MKTTTAISNAITMCTINGIKVNYLHTLNKSHAEGFMSASEADIAIRAYLACARDCGKLTDSEVAKIMGDNHG